MGRRQTRSWACETGMPLGTNATKMHWRGMLGARRGMPVLSSRGEIQACMWAWHARDWAWHASIKFQRATMEDTKGEWHARLGVARLTHQLLWECHLSKGAWHANSPFQ
ncbi:hypothetical protein AHAS_Ahas18G0207100 [Arachis hypogaea]